MTKDEKPSGVAIFDHMLPKGEIELVSIEGNTVLVKINEMIFEGRWQKFEEKPSMEIADKQDKMRLLSIIIDLIISQGFTLSEVVSVWNDVVEGKQ
jgi:hypothetical protein